MVYIPFIIEAEGELERDDANEPMIKKQGRYKEQKKVLHRLPLDKPNTCIRR